MKTKQIIWLVLCSCFLLAKCEEETSEGSYSIESGVTIENSTKLVDKIKIIPTVVAGQYDNNGVLYAVDSASGGTETYGTSWSNCASSSGCGQSSGCASGSGCGAVSCGGSCNTCYNSCVQQTQCNAVGCQNGCRQSCVRDRVRVPQPTIIRVVPNIPQPSGGGGSGTFHGGNLSNNQESSAPSSSNITTEIKIDNNISNNLTIQNPIFVNSTNINNIIFHPNLSQSITDQFSSSLEGRTSEPGRVVPPTDPRCCVNVPPPVCHYNNTGLNCESRPYKECSNNCQSTITVPHYIPRPYPVQVPVYITKQVPVVQYVNRPYYITVPQKVPYPVPVPTYVERPHPVPVPVYVPKVVDRQVPVYVNRVVDRPVPVYVPRVVDRPVQTPCNNYVFGGGQMPVCQSYTDSWGYMGTDTRFIVDQNLGAGRTCTRLNQYPWFDCSQQLRYEDCGACLSCQGSYNFPECINSNLCSESCRSRLLSADPGLLKNSIKSLNCYSNERGEPVCS